MDTKTLDSREEWKQTRLNKAKQTKIEIKGENKWNWNFFSITEGWMFIFSEAQLENHPSFPFLSFLSA